jgi:hypothetical protein
MGERRDPYSMFLGEPEGKRPLGRPRHRWEDNIEMDHQEVGCWYMNSISTTLAVAATKLNTRCCTYTFELLMLGGETA